MIRTMERQRFETDVLPYLPAAFDDAAVQWLSDHGFFHAPASTKYHGAEPGGLFHHSLAVMQELATLTEQLGLKWERPESPYLVGIFHDLCKIDQYVHAQDDSRAFRFSTDTLLPGHGDKSVMLLSTLTTLTMEEVACIRYHMGAFTEKEQWQEYTRAVAMYPNVLWTHTADMFAAHVVGV